MVALAAIGLCCVAFCVAIARMADGLGTTAFSDGRALGRNPWMAVMSDPSSAGSSAALAYRPEAKTPR